MPGIGEPETEVLGAAGPLFGVEGRSVLGSVANLGILQDIANAVATNQNERASKLQSMVQNCNAKVDSWRDEGHGLHAALPAVLINLPPEETQASWQ